MFKAILMTQRTAIYTAVGMTSAFALFFFGSMIVDGGGLDFRAYPPGSMLEYGRVIGLMHGLGAFLTGFLAAISSAEGDLAGKHIYALSLPLPRWHYLLLRFGAGLVLVAGCTAVLTFLDTGVTMLITLPEGMHAYPGALGVRFFFASLLVYAISFALGTLDNRRGAQWMIGILAALGLALWAASAITHVTAWSIASRLLLLPASPLRIIIGSWAFIDV
jgi:hypothetical protein